MNPFETALEEMKSVEYDVLTRTADGESIAGGMQAIRDCAIRTIRIMRELIEALATERGAP